MTRQNHYRIASFNLEDFYLLLDHNYSKEEFNLLTNKDLQEMSSSLYIPNKSLEKIHRIATMIQNESPDVLGLMEVGGRETIANFNKFFLDEQYECFLFEENSKRGIFVGALVRKGVFKKIRIRNVPVKFSRNVLELRLRTGSQDLFVYVVHLKSHAGQEQGIEMRTSEIKQLCRILPQRSCILMGDFNGLAIPGMHQFEFEPLLQLPFRDVLEARGVPPLERVTHFWFDPLARFNQLDYIFCSNDIQVLNAHTRADFIPQNMNERRWMASDHCMILADIRLKRVL